MRLLENQARRRRSRGFTVIEVMLVAALMSLLVVLISGAWSGLGRSTADTANRCRIAKEINLAAECLAADLGGSLPEETAGTKAHGRLVGRMAVAGSELRLCFDGDDDGEADWGSPDTVVVYELDTEISYGTTWNRLVRRNLRETSEFTAAVNVEQIQVTELSDAVEIDLTFAYRNITRTYTITAREP